MKAKVYFADMHCRKQADNKTAKIERLCEAVGLKNILKKDGLTAIKLHFGEYGNDTHLRPQLVRKVADLVKQEKAKPFLTDTNTLYSGSRKNSVDHLETAYAHGFSPSTMDAPIIIADGLHGRNQVAVPTENLKYFKETYIAREIYEADAMVVLSHFKGHLVAGFGGAIKNLSMGCASFWGKRAQHDTKVRADRELCTACGSCVKICPAQAVSIKKEDDKKSAFVDRNKCIGCFECQTVCEAKAMCNEHDADLCNFAERIAEYAYGAVQNKKGKVIYINFLLSITPDCDCVSWSDAPMVADIGILASADPVAIDKASFDLVTKAQSLHPMENSGIGIDKFSRRWERTHGSRQFEHAAEIGLGSLDYELITI